MFDCILLFRGRFLWPDFTCLLLVIPVDLVHVCIVLQNKVIITYAVARAWWPVRKGNLRLLGMMI